MPRKQMPIEVARALSHEWYRWSDERLGRVRRGNITVYRERYKGLVYGWSRIKKFPADLFVYPYNRRNDRVHYPRRALQILDGQGVVASRVEFWCGQNSYHTEARTWMTPNESLCWKCTAYRAGALVHRKDPLWWV